MGFIPRGNGVNTNKRFHAKVQDSIDGEHC